IFDTVNRALTHDLLAAFAKEGERRCIFCHRIFKTNLRERALFVADDDGGMRDVFKTAVLHPQLVGIVRVDIDRGWHIAERIANQRESRFMLANGCIALPFKCGIDQRELPGGRSLLSEDAVAPSVEVRVFGFVADLIKRGESRASMEIDMT